MKKLDSINYIIQKESSSEYNVVKFLNGEHTQEYRVARYNTGLECSCLSGIYRGYCKHKDWVNMVERKQELPDNIEVQQIIKQEDMSSLFNSILGEQYGK